METCVAEPVGEPMTVTRRATHTPVLVEAVMDSVSPKPGQTVVDCTVGAGGHSLAVLPHLMPDGRLLALDRDARALDDARRRLVEFGSHVEFMQDDFRHLSDILRRHGMPRVDGLIADLGISSLHVDEAERGFSFSKEGPLDMRMDVRQSVTAASLIRTLSEQELARLLQASGEERWARRIAKRIVEGRRAHPIETTMQLARIVADAVPSRSGSQRLHPATRTFLALRMAVNDELGSLEALLASLPEILAPGGRAAVIAFHSLEDRLVKRAFRQGAAEGRYRLLTKKPVVPSEQEVRANPRSRSAKLRAVERLP